MHSQLDNEEGRAIVPRARKSIHDHKGLCLIKACDNMGRYGADKSLVDAPSVSIHGKDEIDNIFSKPVRTSPLKSNKIQYVRRNSLSNQYTEDSEEEHEEVGISKNQDEINTKNHTNFENETPFYSNNIMLNESLNSSNNSNYSNMSRESFQTSSYQPSRQQSKKSVHIVLVPVVVLLIGAATAYYNNTTTSNQESNLSKYNEVKFYQDMDILARKYKITDTPLLKLKTGLSTISDREDTGSFIFLYNSKNLDFDESRFENFVESVASAAARYLRNNNDTPTRHLLVDDLDMRTHGELINRYRYDLEKKGVMLVKELDKIPSRLAMAFHFYCDEYNPLAKKSAVFFTLDLGKCSNTSERKTNAEKHADVEKCLISKWNGVPQDNIRPLLTRVVNVIIDVTNVF